VAREMAEGSWRGMLGWACVAESAPVVIRWKQKVKQGKQQFVS